MIPWNLTQQNVIIIKKKSNSRLVAARKHENAKQVKEMGTLRISLNEELAREVSNFGEEEGTSQGPPKNGC